MDSVRHNSDFLSCVTQNADVWKQSTNWTVKFNPFFMWIMPTNNQYHRMYSSYSTKRANVSCFSCLSPRFVFDDYNEGYLDLGQSCLYMNMIYVCTK